MNAALLGGTPGEKTFRRPSDISQLCQNTLLGCFITAGVHKPSWHKKKQSLLVSSDLQNTIKKVCRVIAWFESLSFSEGEGSFRSQDWWQKKHKSRNQRQISVAFTLFYSLLLPLFYHYTGTQEHGLQLFFKHNLLGNLQAPRHYRFPK